MIELLTKHLSMEEGFKSNCYTDTEGFLTIGIGRLIDPRRDGGISRKEAEFLLENDIDRVCTQLDSAIPWWLGLSDTRKVVLASMAFQMGVGTLLTFTNTLKHVRTGNYFLASEAMLASLWAKQTPDRANRLAYAMRSDDPGNLT